MKTRKSQKLEARFDRRNERRISKGKPVTKSRIERQTRRIENAENLFRPTLGARILKKPIQGLEKLSNTIRKK